MPTVTNIGAQPGVTVVGRNATIRVRPTITAALYTALNVVGGIQTLPLAVSQLNGSSRLENLMILDRANQKVGGAIYFFKSQPGLAGGVWTDKTAVTVRDDDLLICGAVQVSAADYVTIGGSTRAFADVPLFGSRLMQSEDAAFALYAAFVTSGAPTYLTNNDLQFDYRFSYAD